MKSAVELKPVFSFLKDLERNNNKASFDSNRARYDEAQSCFETYVAALMAGMHSSPS